MDRATWPAEPPLEVPKLISNSMSYGSCRRTSATSSMLAGFDPPLVPKSSVAGFAANMSAVNMYQTVVLILSPSPDLNFSIVLYTCTASILGYISVHGLFRRLLQAAA